MFWNSENGISVLEYMHVRECLYVRNERHDLTVRWDSVCGVKRRYSSLSPGRGCETNVRGGCMRWYVADCWSLSNSTRTGEMRDEFYLQSDISYIYRCDDIIFKRRYNSNSKEGFPCLTSDHSQVLNSWPNLTPILWTAIVKFESKTKDTPRLSDIVTLNVLDPCVVML